MSATEVRLHCQAQMDEQAQSLLRLAMAQLALSARAFHRILKLARTIADMARVRRSSRRTTSPRPIQYRQRRARLSEGELTRHARWSASRGCADEELPHHLPSRRSSAFVVCRTESIGQRRGRRATCARRREWRRASPRRRRAVQLRNVDSSTFGARTRDGRAGGRSRGPAAQSDSAAPHRRAGFAAYDAEVARPSRRTARSGSAVPWNATTGHCEPHAPYVEATTATAAICGSSWHATNCAMPPPFE